MESIDDIKRKYKNTWPNIIMRLSQFNKKLKCCGNCKNNSSMQIAGIVREENCTVGKGSVASYKYCGDWEFDGLSQINRIFKREVKEE